MSSVSVVCPEVTGRLSPDAHKRLKNIVNKKVRSFKQYQACNGKLHFILLFPVKSRSEISNNFLKHGIET